MSFTGPLAALGSVPLRPSGPSVLGTAEAALQLYRTDCLEVKAQYKPMAGELSLSQYASLCGALHF